MVSLLVHSFLTSHSSESHTSTLSSLAIYFMIRNVS